jgi:hypothetical protein
MQAKIKSAITEWTVKTFEDLHLRFKDLWFVLQGNLGKDNLGKACVITEKIEDGAITSAKIADGTIVNADINASAAIAESKVAFNTTSGHDHDGTDSKAITVNTLGAVPTTRTISASNGLTGGGDLSADRTLSPTYGTDANTVCQGNDARLSDARTPTAHANSHASGQSDAIKLDDLAAPDDNSDLDVSTSKHGLTPKAPNETNKFFRGDATWTIVPFGFGDGSDGDVTISGNTSLSRTMQYRNLTVNNGVVLNANGHVIYVGGTLTNNGTIACNGGNGTDGVSGGAAGAPAIQSPQRPFLPLSAAGGTGGAGGTAGTNNGSAGGAGTGGITYNRGGFPNLWNIGGGGGGGGNHGAVVTAGTAGGTVILTIGPGGAGGAGTGTGSTSLTGGGGGAGGGAVLIFAFIINNAGTISANGGAGGAGQTSGSDKSGNGGGGGGGEIRIYYRSTTGSGVGTLQAVKGAAGSGGNGGSAGTDGFTYYFQM